MTCCLFMKKLKKTAKNVSVSETTKIMIFGFRNIGFAVKNKKAASAAVKKFSEYFKYR